MASSSDEEGGHGRGARSRAGDGSTVQDWAEPTTPQRDWKKLTLVVGLGVLSWVATYVGMLELIEANMGELPLIHKVIIGFSVGMLMTMIIWLLDQLFAPIGLFTKLVYAGGYIFLTIISVGFGFGFYWKVLESRSESSRSAESAVTQVQSSLHAASTRLEQLQSTLVQLTHVSTQKAETERTSGTSCPNSKPGDGPRRKMREDDAARFGFASEFVKGRVGAVKADMATLDVEFARISKDDKGTVDARTGNRNEFMKALSRKLDMTVTGFNAFRTDPQLKQIRADLAERAEKVSFVDTKGGAYVCPDPQLQTALRGVVRAIEQLPEMEKPKIAAVEGSEATIEAFRRLTATFYGMLAFKLPPSADELRQLQQRAVQSVEPGAPQARMAALNGEVGLSKRDYVPLAIAIFVDICLLLVSMGRPVNRLSGLVPKMRAAERGPVYQILSKFSEIHKDEETREKFEIFRHVVFDFNGDYYVAVPLNAPVKANPEQKLEMQLEAHLLSNLFTSFEKERIFSRVHSPFLTTRAIQRKLWRQGSKFAHSEAFRIYRFRDGAWSEIILGAVMGAARRIDSEKYRLQHEQGHRLPTPDMAADHLANEAHSIRDQWRLNGDDRPAAGRTSHASGHENPLQPSGPYNRNGYHKGTTMRTDRSQRSGHAPGLRSLTGGGGNAAHRPAARTMSAQTEDAGTLARQFGPYANSVADSAGYGRPATDRTAPSANYREMAHALNAVGSAHQQVREAEVSVRAANNNSASPGDAIYQPEAVAQAKVADDTPAIAEAMAASGLAAANVVAMPRVATPPRAGEAMTAMPMTAPIDAGVINVTVRRETATFSVPVSEARLPQSLASLIGQAVVAGQALRQADVTDVAQAPVVGESTDEIAAGRILAVSEKPAGNALAVIQYPAGTAPVRDLAGASEQEIAQRFAGRPAE